MNRKTLLLTTIASGLILAGTMAGCGGDDDSSPPSTGTTASSNPASASDESKDAPDDAISDRPGGPNAGPPK